jgi:hypothetical protein
MNIAAPTMLEPDPTEIDPRPCALCGLTIDRHKMVDDGEGPEFFCDDIEHEIYLRAAELVRQWELADARDSHRHTGEAPARMVDRLQRPKPYEPPQTTIDAFFYVVGLDDPDYLKRWLEQHPRDAETLCKLWEGKNASQA